MKLAHYQSEGKIRVGIVKEDRIFGLSDGGISELDGVKSIDELLSREKLHLVRKEESKILSGASRPLDSVRLASPILHPAKIYCAAVNYISHGKEQNAEPPTQPYFFTKFGNALIGQDVPILVPRVSRKVDWEVELAVIIGKKGKYIPRNVAMDYVAGYSISNDVSFRDLQRPDGSEQKPSRWGPNWVKGKGLDNSFPLGPWLVTADEFGNPYEKRISLSVNGTTKQDSSVGEMVFKIDQMIEYLSNGTTLLPGDVISTGTPMGVAAYSGSPFLKEGDMVEAAIEGLGRLRNPVKNEA